MLVLGLSVSCVLLLLSMLGVDSSILVLGFWVYFMLFPSRSLMWLLLSCQLLLIYLFCALLMAQ